MTRNSRSVIGITRDDSTKRGQPVTADQAAPWLKVGPLTDTSAFRNLAVESRAIMAARNGTQTKINDAEVHERLCRARQFIDDSYHLPLDLAAISNQACLSRYHFLRLFRDAFETTPHQYLIQRRIERAKELLRGRSLTVTDVCFEVGFESLGSFSSLFRRCVGDAPTSYRRRERRALRKIPGCYIQMFGLGQ